MPFANWPKSQPKQRDYAKRQIVKGKYDLPSRVKWGGTKFSWYIWHKRCVATSLRHHLTNRYCEQYL
jgi:hypothetical protein